MSWRVARSLDVLLDEINTAAPNRSKVSDGSIGDAAHASRDSDHNPWVIADGVGIVRARDFTHDPARGLDCNTLALALAELMREGRHPALGSGAYIIWNRRILSRDRVGEGWRSYTGSNPHTAHLHLSVALARDSFDSTARWGVMNQEDDMADYADQLDRIEKQNQRILDRLGADAVIRKRLKAIVQGLDELADAVKDDATKQQVRRVREDLARLGDDA